MVEIQNHVMSCDLKLANSACSALTVVYAVAYAKMRVLWGLGRLSVTQTSAVRTLQLVRRLTTPSETTSSIEGSSYQLPWTQHSRPFADREPFINRTVGLFLLRRIAGSHGYTFSVSEFLHGVKEAVFSLATILSSPEKHDSLHTVLSPRLCAGVRQSLDSMPSGSRMHLDVESIRHLQLSCINSVIGATDPGDEHTFEWLGQRVIASRSELRAMEEIEVKFTFQSGRELALEAASTHMEFQLGVGFKTKEKFAVLDSGGEVVAGSNQFLDCFHMWRFSSSVRWDGDVDYPFSWTILDINNHLTEAASSQ